MDEYPPRTSDDRLQREPLLDRPLLDRPLLDRPPLDQPLLDLVFQALADPTRRAMLARLGHGARSVGELAAPFQISLAAASKHIKTLERAGLIQRTVTGRSHVCALDPAPLARAMAWLRQASCPPTVGPSALPATAASTPPPPEESPDA